MEKHLTLEDHKQETDNLLNYKNEMKHLYARACGRGKDKSLFITGNGDFLIESNGKEVLRTMQAFTAIETYFNL